MNVGLPGTGLGGLFYIVMALLMLVREGSKFLIGRGEIKKLRLAAKLSTMAITMVAVVVATIWFFSQSGQVLAESGLVSNQGFNFRLTGQALPIYITLAILIGLISLINGLGKYFSWLRDRKEILESGNES